MEEMKKILVIMPKFDQYGHEIKKYSRHSADLIEYDEYSLIKRNALIRLLYIFLSLFNKVRSLNKITSKINFRSKNFNNVNHYVKKEIDALCTNIYSTIIWIKCDGISDNVFDYAMSIFPGRHVLYLYDPIIRYPDIVRNFKRFKSIFTFDLGDAKKYHIKHLPMFRHINLIDVKIDKTVLYSTAFIGEFSWYRFFMLLKSVKKISLPYRFILVSRWMPNTKFMGIELISSRLKSSDIYEIYKKSACMLEILNPGQSGITQRFHDANTFDLCLVSVKNKINIYEDGQVDITFKIFISKINNNNQDLKLIQKSLTKLKAFPKNDLIINIDDFIRELVNNY